MVVVSEYLISQSQSDIIRSFAIFYLLIICSDVAPSIITPVQSAFIKTNVGVQLFLTFMTFFFLVFLVSTTREIEMLPPFIKLLYSISYFILFITLLKININIFACIIILIFVGYFIDVNKAYYFSKTKAGGIVVNEQKDSDHAYWISIKWPVKADFILVKPEQYHILNRLFSLVYYIIAALFITGFVALLGSFRELKQQHPNVSVLEFVFSDRFVCLSNSKHTLFKRLQDAVKIF